MLIPVNEVNLIVLTFTVYNETLMHYHKDSVMQKHETYLDTCIRLAKQALKNGDPPVGSVVVLGNQIVGEGVESGKSTGDITNHAEILAINDAIKNGFKDQLGNAVLYSTHEPCIMCSYVIRHYLIKEVIYSLHVEFVGGYTSDLKVLSSQSNPNWGLSPKVVTGICANQCESLNKEFELILKTKK